jgi:hypothetical protein
MLHRRIQRDERVKMTLSVSLSSTSRGDPHLSERHGSAATIWHSLRTGGLDLRRGKPLIHPMFAEQESSRFDPPNRDGTRLQKLGNHLRSLRWCNVQFLGQPGRFPGWIYLLGEESSGLQHRSIAVVSRSKHPRGGQPKRGLGRSTGSIGYLEEVELDGPRRLVERPSEERSHRVISL